MSMATYLDEVYEESLEKFNENFQEFLEGINERKEEIDEHKQFQQTIASFDGDDEVLADKTTEEEIYELFYKELVDFVGKKVGGDVMMTLAQNHLLDDLIYQITQEKFDDLYVLLGLD